MSEAESFAGAPCAAALMSGLLGARGLCGRGTPGWRWLDIRALAQRIVSNLPHWQAARIARVVYCTAVIDAASNPSGYNEQEVYLKALTTANSVDYIAYGSYVPRVKYAPLAVKAASSRRTDLTDGRSDAGGPPCQHTADFITALRVVTRIHEPAAVGAAFGRELRPILPPFTLISRNELLVLDFRCRFSPDILKHWPTVPAAG